MLIEQGDVQENLDAMMKRDNFNRFYLSRREQNHLNTAPFVDGTVKAIRESEAPETLIVFESPSHRMDQYVSTIAQLIAKDVDSEHRILAICVETAYFNELKEDS